MRNKTLRFLAAMAELKVAPAYATAHRSGLTPRECSTIASKLVTAGRLSRIKPKESEGGGPHRYYLTDEQLDAFYRLHGHVVGGGLYGVDAVGVTARLKLLRTLKERTVYRDNPALDAIIGDYERTLSRARRAEEVQIGALT